METTIYWTCSQARSASPGGWCTAGGGRHDLHRIVSKIGVLA